MLNGRWIEDVGEAVEDDLWSIYALNLSLAQKGDPLASSHLVEIGRRGHDSDTPLLEHAEHLPEFLSAHGIHSGGGLIKHQHAGAVNKCTTEGKFLLHASRKVASLAVAEPFDLPVDSLDAVITRLDGSPEERGKKLQILLHREVLVQGETPRHIANTLADFDHLLHHIKAVNGCRPRVWQQQCAQDPKQRCLASAVRADKAEHLTLADGERHVGECLHFAVGLGDMTDFDGVHDSELLFIGISPHRTFQFSHTRRS